jgi:lysophospholipase L1-like esterase
MNRPAKITCFILALSLSFISGCGGGSASSDSAPTVITDSNVAPAMSAASDVASATTAAIVPSSPCTPRAPVKVQLFGDSTLYGYDSATGARAQVYPALALQRTMDARFGSGVITIESRAVSGTTTSTLIGGTDGLNKVWPESVDADIIVTNFGINDQITGMAPEVYRANLLTLSRAPAKILFLTPLPYWKVVTLQPTYAAEMKLVAASLGAPVADANAMALAIPAWSTSYARDGAHPTSAGYQLINDRVLAPAIDKMVLSLGCK